MSEVAGLIEARTRHLPALFSSRRVVMGVAIILFVLLCLLPILYMFGLSLIGADGELSFENYRRLLAERRQRELLTNSTLLGAGAAALATALGSPLGLILARADLPAKQFLRLSLVVPLVLPPYILALAWIYIGGSAGLVAQALGRDLLSSWTYSLPGAIFILGVSFFPISMLATEAAARRVDGRLEEAGLIVARPCRVLWRITLPLIAPTIAAAALVVFVLALAEFAVPGLLRVRVFTTEVFTAFAALYDFGAATALAAPMLVIALVVGVAVKIAMGERPLVTRRALQPGLRLGLGRWRTLVLAGLGLILVMTVMLPIMVLALEAGQLERIAAAVKASGGAIANSLMLATAGAILIAGLGLLLGYGRGRARTRLRGIVDVGLIVIFAVPSTVVGIGLIGMWNRTGLLGEVYRSPMIILIAYLARFLPVATLMMAAAVRQVPVSFEEAAEVAGASWPRSFARIIFPQILMGVAATLIVSFIFAFGELGATVLVAPPGESTLPVRIYTIIANAPSSEVSALALMQTGIILMPVAVFGIIARIKGGNS